MKFNYKKHTEVNKTVELKVPYYYEIMSEDYEIYGKLSKDCIVEFLYMRCDDRETWEVERNYDIKNSINSILRQDKSAKEKFESAKQKILEFMK